MEEREIVTVSEINLFLASLDVLELDLVLEIYPTDC